MKFQIDQSPGGDGFIFQLLSDNGEMLLSSSPFADREGCTDAIRTAIDRMADEDNFESTSEGGRFYAILSAAGGGSLARSEVLANKTAADARISQIVDQAEDQEDYEVTMTTTTAATVTTPAFMGSAFTDYASLYDFTLSSTSGRAGLDLFQSAKDQEYYFFFNDAAGKSILYSRGYKEISRRKKRIAQVIKNAQREDKYELHESSGKYYFILNGSNGQEIARSPMFNTTGERDAAIAYLRGNVGEYAPEYIKPRKKRPKKVVNQYNLDHASTSGKEGFETFRHAEDKQHYFHFNDEGGKALLFSQGYSSVKSRDNGVRAVIKNGGDRTRYELREEDGKHYFILRAGNRQEIARSRNFSSAVAAEKYIDYLIGIAPRYATQYGVLQKDIITSQTETFTLSVDRDTAAPVAVAGSQRVVDDYLPCDDYRHDKKGFHSFYREDRKEHYFSYIGDSGDVLLRSEGYTTTAARDNGIASVKKNAPIEKRWIKDTVMDGRYYYYALRAGNNQEIARSCYYDDEAAMLAAFGWLGGTFGFAALAGTAAASAVAATQPTTAPKAAVVPPAAAVAKPTPAAAAPPPAAPAKSGGFPWGWLLPLLLLLLLLLLIPYLFRSCSDGDGTPMAGKTPPAAEKAPPALQNAAPGEADDTEGTAAQPSEKPAPAGGSERSATPPATTAPAPEAPQSRGPDAATLGFAANSVEGMLANYLSNPGSTFPKTFRLENVLFETNSDRLTAVARQTLDRVARVLKEFPSATFNIEGHTDNRGDAGYNMDLSQRRAVSVGSYLSTAGINSTRFSTRGFGDTRPAGDNSTAEGQRNNRRVDLVVTGR